MGRRSRRRRELERQVPIGHGGLGADRLSFEQTLEAILGFVGRPVQVAVLERPPPYRVACISSGVLVGTLDETALEGEPLLERLFGDQLAERDAVVLVLGDDPADGVTPVEAAARFGGRLVVLPRHGFEGGHWQDVEIVGRELTILAFGTEEFLISVMPWPVGGVDP